MPKQTFLNLSLAKQHKILSAARDVFLDNPIEKVSISMIVRAADIPRGSFYQYFEHLDDLFQHLMREVMQRFEDFVLKRAASRPMTLFDYFRSAFDSDYDYFMTSHHHELMNKFFKEKKMLGFDTDFFEKRRSEFFKSFLACLDASILDGYTFERKFKVYRLVIHIKFQYMQKALRDENEFDQAKSDYLWFLETLEAGMKATQ